MKHDEPVKHALPYHYHRHHHKKKADRFLIQENPWEKGKAVTTQQQTEQMTKIYVVARIFEVNSNSMQAATSG